MTRTAGRPFLLPLAGAEPPLLAYLRRLQLRQLLSGATLGRMDGLGPFECLVLLAVFAVAAAISILVRR